VAERLRFVLRTPHQVVHDGPLRAARVPAATGQVGLRPRCEPLILAVEPGLVLLRREGGLAFAGTAGGLLETDGETCTLYTPFAVVGDEADGVLSALDRALATPDTELSARRQLGELEQRIARELNDRRAPIPLARSHHGTRTG
jgi:F0F1-type ATP synthase epsilon subunit